MMLFSNWIQRIAYHESFFGNIDMVFSESNFHAKTLKCHLAQNHAPTPKIVVTGFPRFDNLEQYVDADSILWKFPKDQGKFRVLWTPRWNTNERNSHFFDYKDLLLEYADKNEDVDFIFRPHPQTFRNFTAFGEMDEAEVENYRKEYRKRKNATIDSQPEYLNTFYSSSAMVTDISSVIPEYFLTGKPIIYCHKTDCFNAFGKRLSKGFYWVNNWHELEQTLNMIKSGSDPLKEKRLALIKSEFYFPPEGAGMKIKEILKMEFYK
jgi:UDP-N-acetylglucosamine 2-epimerase